MTMPLAWSTTMVAWGMLDFQDGYTSAGETQAGQRFLQWSVQYLLKTIVGTQAKPLDIKLIWQVQTRCTRCSELVALHPCQCL